MIQILRDSLAVLNPKEKGKFRTGISLSFFITIVDILSLAVLVFIVSYYTQGTKNSFFSVLPAWISNHNSVLLIAIFFVLFSIKNLAAFLVFRFQYRFICEVANRLAIQKLIEFLDGEYRDYIDTDSAAHTRRISHQPTEFSQYVLAGIQQIITELLLVLLAVTAIAIYNPKLFLLLFVVLLPPVIAVFYIIKKRLRKASRDTKTNSEKSLQYLHEALGGFVESNIYDRKNFFLKRFATYQQLFNKHLSEAMIVQGMPHRIIEVFAVLGLFILIAVGQTGPAHVSSAFVTIGAFMAGAYKIIPGVVKILNLGSQVRTYEFTIKDLMPSKRLEKKSAVEGKIQIDSIEFKRVLFSFGERPVLKNFNLTIKRGDLVGLSGDSGEGKTTVLNLLLGFLSPLDGEILINGNGEEDRKIYWPSIAYVKQQSFLLHDTILRNITLQEEKPDAGMIKCAIKASGLDALLNKYPEGLDKLITENGKNISGGERQRIAIARALYKKADLIILDEPFNELDETSEFALLTHFRDLAKQGRIVILITHHTKGLEFCNKIVSLHEATC